MPPWATPSSYNYAPSTLYIPASTASREQSATLQPANFVQHTAELQPRQQPTTVIVLKGGGAWIARDYWVEGGQLHCVTPDGEQKLVALEAMDLNQTVGMNRERRVDFVLRSKDPLEQ
jgi:hypothetical protein